jgi:hypothetical protein
VSIIIVAASRQTSIVTRRWGIWDKDMFGLETMPTTSQPVVLSRPVPAVLVGCRHIAQRGDMPVSRGSFDGHPSGLRLRWLVPANCVLAGHFP